MGVTIEVRNYRCFPRESPLRLELQPGFTAFVGPNNSGKSTALRLFFELRQFFRQIGDASVLTELFRGGSQPAALNEPPASDAAAIFSDGNDDPLEIQFRSDEPGAEFALTFSIERRERRLTLRHGLSARPDPANFNAATVHGETLRERPEAGSAALAELSPLFAATRHAVRALYIPAFRNALSVETPLGPYYDVQIGKPLVAQWHSHKTGNNRTANELAIELTASLARLFEFKQLEINASSDLNTLRLIINNKPFPLAEIGGGFAQFFITLLNAAIRKPSYILIDEPELNLHPRLQLEFLTTLGSYAEEGVLFATHNLGLARSAAERIYSVRRVDGGSRVAPLEASRHLGELLGELSFSGSFHLGYRTILLVEGSTEVKAVQQLLRLYRKDHSVVLLPLGGSDMIRAAVAVELAEVKRLAEDGKVAALIDSERPSAEAPLAADRRAFADACAELSIECHVLGRRAIENYFPQRALRAAFGAAMTALGAYDRLRDHNPGWPKSQNWKITREMTREDLAGTDLDEALAAL